MFYGVVLRAIIICYKMGVSFGVTALSLSKMKIAEQCQKMGVSFGVTALSLSKMKIAEQCQKMGVSFGVTALSLSKMKKIFSITTMAVTPKLISQYSIFYKLH